MRMRDFAHVKVGLTRLFFSFWGSSNHLQPKRPYRLPQKYVIRGGSAQECVVSVTESKFLNFSLSPQKIAILWADLDYFFGLILSGDKTLACFTNDP